MNRASMKPGATVGGKYRLEELLGQGGMGSVFAAVNILTGKRVAIKCMNDEVAANPEASKRFLREARASARIRHPNVVDVYDVVSEQGSFFLIMELLEGEPLSLLMARETLPLPTLIKLLQSAMRGVVAAHRQGIVHRDIKPENIFLACEGDDAQVVPKVLDFGISKIQGTQEVALTAPGSMLGTVLYMSTEQLNGDKDVDARADVYAFGVILYQAISGRLPFEAETLSALVYRIITEQPAPLSTVRVDVPLSLSQLVERSMAKHRDQRLPTLEALIEGLSPFADDLRYRGQWTRRSSWSSPAPVASEAKQSNRESAPVAPARAVPVSSQTPFTSSRPSSPEPRMSRRGLAVLLLGALSVAGAGAWFWPWLAGAGQRQSTKRDDAQAGAAVPIVFEPRPPVPTPAVAATAAPGASGVAPAPPDPVPPAAEPPQRKEPDPPALAPKPAAAQTTAVRELPRPTPAATPRKLEPPRVNPAPAPARPVVTPPSPKRPGCNPNFYLDAQGEKHFKPECF